LLGDEQVRQTSSISASHGGDFKKLYINQKYGPNMYALREQNEIFSTVKNFCF